MANVRCADDFEPNNNFGLAPVLNVNTPYWAAICDSSDVDYYAFSVGSGYRLRAAIYSLPADFELDLFDSNYDWLASSTNPNLAEEIISWDVYKGGLFYMAVHAKQGEYSDNPYWFEMDIWYRPTETPTPTATATPAHRVYLPGVLKGR